MADTIYQEVVEAYFHSIEQSFKRTYLEQKFPGLLDAAIAIDSFFFLISVVPILPALLSRVTPLLFGRRATSVFGYSVFLDSLGTWWALCVGSTILCLALLTRLTSKRAKSRAEIWLSRPQMRFSYCYAIVDQVRQYEADHSEQHIEQSWKWLLILNGYLLSDFSLFHDFYRDTKKHKPLFTVSMTAPLEWPTMPLIPFLEIEHMKAKFPWFSLDRRTEMIVQAFLQLDAKARYILHTKKNLSSLGECLSDLAGYLYSQIPEVASGEIEGQVATDGQTSIESFARKVNSLPPPFMKEEVGIAQSTYLGQVSFKLSSVFSHPNLIISFFAWWLSIQVLVLLEIWALMYFAPGMDLDTTLASTIIGVPILSAANFDLTEILYQAH